MLVRVLPGSWLHWYCTATAPDAAVAVYRTFSSGLALVLHSQCALVHWYYSGTAEVPCGRYASTTLLLHRYCACITMVLHRYCHGSMMLLHLYYIHATLVLHGFCTWYCTCNTLALGRYYIGRLFLLRHGCDIGIALVLWCCSGTRRSVVVLSLDGACGMLVLLAADLALYWQHYSSLPHQSCARMLRVLRQYM